jgi:hypothetical protein
MRARFLFSRFLQHSLQTQVELFRCLVDFGIVELSENTGGAVVFEGNDAFLGATQGPGDSGQRCERRGLEGQQLVVAGLLHLARPGRIDQQRAADRD